MVDPNALLAANEAFYSAFTRRDFAAMDRMWAREHAVACIHPGWPPLRDREEVMASWRRVLADPSSPRVACREASAHVVGGAAFVICFEIVQGGRLAATNVFVREGDEWCIAHHHAGPVAASSAEPDPVDRRTLN